MSHIGNEARASSTRLHFILRVYEGNVVEKRRINPEVLLEPAALALVVTQLRRKVKLVSKERWGHCEGRFTCRIERLVEPVIGGYHESPHWEPVGHVLDAEHINVEMVSS